MNAVDLCLRRKINYNVNPKKIRDDAYELSILGYDIFQNFITKVVHF